MRTDFFCYLGACSRRLTSSCPFWYTGCSTTPTSVSTSTRSRLTLCVDLRARLQTKVLTVATAAPGQFFYGVDWNTLRHIEAPFVPHLKSGTDTSYFPTEDLDGVPMDTMVDHNAGKGGKDLAFLGYSAFPALGSPELETRRKLMRLPLRYASFPTLQPVMMRASLYSPGTASLRAPAGSGCPAPSPPPPPLLPPPFTTHLALYAPTLR